MYMLNSLNPKCQRIQFLLSLQNTFVISICVQVHPVAMHTAATVDIRSVRVYVVCVLSQLAHIVSFFSY